MVESSGLGWRKAELPAWRTFQAPAGAGSGSLREQSLAFEAGEAAECTAAAEGLRALCSSSPQVHLPPAVGLLISVCQQVAALP